jgi:hypothetical protein
MVDTVPTRSSPRDQTREERIEILRLLETGAITVDEAATLLDALDRAGGQPAGGGSAPPRGGAEGGQMRIRVTERGAGEGRVNRAVPLGEIETGIGIASQFVPEYLPTVEAIRESANAGFRGSLLDVDDGGQRVEIIVE